jgi:putative transcriptional regulator
MNRKEIKNIRKKLKMNTKQFGDAVGVSSRTVESWEQGLRRPSQSAQIIMKMLEKHN